MILCPSVRFWFQVMQTKFDDFWRWTFEYYGDWRIIRYPAIAGGDLEVGWCLDAMAVTVSPALTSCPRVHGGVVYFWRSDHTFRIHTFENGSYEHKNICIIGKIPTYIGFQFFPWQLRWRKTIHGCTIPWEFIHLKTNEHVIFWEAFCLLRTSL
jgi:hypothetical protein